MLVIHLQLLCRRYGLYQYLYRESALDIWGEVRTEEALMSPLQVESFPS